MSSTLSAIGMDSTSGQFKITQSGDSVNVLQNTSTAIQKGDGTGILVNAVAGTDYQAVGTYVTAIAVASSNGLAGTSSGGATPSLTLSTSITGILKGSSNAIVAATPGSDYTVTLFSSTATATITNTTTETSAIGPGVGSKTLAAGFFTSGRTLRIGGSGVYSAAAVAPGNLTVKIKLGSTVIATTTLGALLSGASNLGYQFEAEIVCRSTGASGTVMTSGSIDYATTSTGTRSFGDLNNAGAVTTIDTTASQVLDVTVTWATASTSNIVNNTIATIEQLW